MWLYAVAVGEEADEVDGPRLAVGPGLAPATISRQASPSQMAPEAMALGETSAAPWA